MFGQKHVLMDKADDGSGGGGAGGAAGAGEGGGATVTLESLQAELAKLKSENVKLAENNKKLLDEKVKTQQTAEEKIKAEQERLKKEAESSGNAAQLLEITKKELLDRENKIKEYENERAERRANQMNKAKKDAFKELFKDHEFNSFDESFNSLSKEEQALFVAMEEEVDGKKVFKGFNGDGLKQLQSKFIKEKAWHFKDKAGNVDRTPAKANGQGGESEKDILAGFAKELTSKKTDL